MSKYLLPSHWKAKDCYFCLLFHTLCYISPNMMCHTKTSHWEGTRLALWLAPLSVDRNLKHTNEMVQRSNDHKTTVRVTCLASWNATDLQVSDLTVWQWPSKNKTKRTWPKHINKIMLFILGTETLCIRYTDKYEDIVSVLAHSLRKVFL